MSSVHLIKLSQIIKEKIVIFSNLQHLFRSFNNFFGYSTSLTPKLQRLQSEPPDTPNFRNRRKQNYGLIIDINEVCANLIMQ
jgi:hypothetical protein